MSMQKNNKTILFLDNTYPHAYSLETLNKQALGGTESSIINTAHILSQKYNVLVAQKYRDNEISESESLKFISKNQIKKYNPDYIVVVRKYKVCKELVKEFPKARIFLWIHTYKNTEYIFKRPFLSRNKVTVICNSQTHKISLDKILNSGVLGNLMSLFVNKVAVRFCYNPVKKPIVDKCKRDINKLLFFSSPNKGLDQVLKTFKSINKEIPELRLFIANPGYKKGENKSENNIIALGSLPHSELMRHIAESLCIFYPQDSFAETFGLIYAEANALGTPVIAHDIGSAKEILHNNNSLINAEDSEQIKSVIKQWQKQLPQIEYNTKFNEENILLQWQQLLSET